MLFPIWDIATEICSQKKKKKNVKGKTALPKQKYVIATKIKKTRKIFQIYASAFILFMFKIPFNRKNN